MQKIRNPLTTPSGILVTGVEKINTENSGLPKFAPLVAYTSLGPIYQK